MRTRVASSYIQIHSDFTSILTVALVDQILYLSGFYLEVSGLSAGSGVEPGSEDFQLELLLRLYAQKIA